MLKFLLYDEKTGKSYYGRNIGKKERWNGKKCGVIHSYTKQKPDRSPYFLISCRIWQMVR